jgi:hypothetical protein
MGWKVAGPSPPHAAVAKATVVKTANEREDLIRRAYERRTVAYRQLPGAMSPVRLPS